MEINDKNEKHEEEIALLLKENGYILVDFKIIKHNKSAHYKIVIDQKGGVSHNDCKKVTKLIQYFLEDNYLPLDNRVEVSSPGLNRKLESLRELKAFLNRKVSVSYLDNDNLLQEIGLLIEANLQKILIMTEAQEEKSLSYKIVKRIRLVD